ncbi:uncharacterized protein THITE_121411 [Thermothielavioides terrestris NRRL 8126]|uniref:Major facilitator superfamily (MFS) profile domain-containing protein n=1 Tax=Thermothielavioides terrestris (strain ATCC 38088 / NRRL 8126) TaxID=578455 RepID=G2R8T8_THETT|nr:uncharacterized protein THITE_121411 [Thermothielavioides terrestris NRRL 8126]AEO68587.1 hypothetical protein THITE_121411 [Thermothielavioides terrestris NRRL 8126]
MESGRKAGIGRLVGCALKNRRPVFLVSLVCSLVGNVGCAVSPSYGTMGLCRAITAFFISPASAIGSAVVAETFFKKERARYMGVWTTMVTLGVPMAPFIFGFVAVRVGYRWIFSQTNGVQLLLYFLVGRETLYLRRAAAAASLRPLAFVARPCVLLPAVGYAMVFLWANIMMSVETGQLFPENFGLNPQQVGLQNISIIVGSLLGEQIGGFLSDWWMWRRHAKVGSSSDGQGADKAARSPQPEFRLWLGYPGHLLTICGVVVYFVQIERAGTFWNITPDVGMAIAAGGNQIVTTVMTTYAVDCYREDAAGVGVFFNFVRQTWGFIGPFWFPDPIQRTGFRASAGIAAAMIVAVSMVPTAVVQWRRSRWRQD